MLTKPVPEAFELPALISKEEQPGVSGVFLHDVGFLIDRHSCVRCSKGKFIEEIQQNV